MWGDNLIVVLICRRTWYLAPVLGFPSLVKNPLPSLWETEVEDSLVVQMVKSLPAMREIWVQSLGWEDPLEKEMATHSSILAWEITWSEEPGVLQSMGWQSVGHDLVTQPQYQALTLDTTAVSCVCLPTAHSYFYDEHLRRKIKAFEEIYHLDSLSFYWTRFCFILDTQNTQVRKASHLWSF